MSSLVSCSTPMRYCDFHVIIRELQRATVLSHGRKLEVNISHARTLIQSSLQVKKILSSFNVVV